MKRNIINYGTLLSEAMHGVIHEALRCVENDQIPGEHFFYISFLTNFKGVKISDALMQKYTEEMTIVLQHQFQDLIVEADRFSITLCFNNKNERLCIPYRSILRFADPSVNIELSFVPLKEGKDSIKKEGTINLDMKNAKNSTAVQQADNVIDLDAFRKKMRL